MFKGAFAKSASCFRLIEVLTYLNDGFTGTEKGMDARNPRVADPMCACAEEYQASSQRVTGSWGIEVCVGGFTDETDTPPVDGC